MTEIDEDEPLEPEATDCKPPMFWRQRAWIRQIVLDLPERLSFGLVVTNHRLWNGYDSAVSLNDGPMPSGAYAFASVAGLGFILHWQEMGGQHRRRIVWGRVRRIPSGSGSVNKPVTQPVPALIENEADRERVAGAIGLLRHDYRVHLGLCQTVDQRRRYVERIEVLDLMLLQLCAAYPVD